MASDFIALGMSAAAIAISASSIVLTIRADRRERARGRDARVAGAVMTKLARPEPAEGPRELTRSASEDIRAISDAADRAVEGAKSGVLADLGGTSRRG